MIHPNKYCPDWVKKFALFPVVHGGYNIWLQFYWKRYVEHTHEHKCKFCHTVGHWEITHINPEKVNT